MSIFLSAWRSGLRGLSTPRKAAITAILLIAIIGGTVVFIKKTPPQARFLPKTPYQISPVNGQLIAGNTTLDLFIKKEGQAFKINIENLRTALSSAATALTQLLKIEDRFTLEWPNLILKTETGDYTGNLSIYSRRQNIRIAGFFSSETNAAVNGQFTITGEIDKTTKTGNISIEIADGNATAGIFHAGRIFGTLDFAYRDGKLARLPASQIEAGKAVYGPFLIQNLTFLFNDLSFKDFSGTASLSGYPESHITYSYMRDSLSGNFSQKTENFFRFMENYNFKIPKSAEFSSDFSKKEIHFNFFASENTINLSYIHPEYGHFGEMRVIFSENEKQNIAAERIDWTLPPRLFRKAQDLFHFKIPEWVKLHAAEIQASGSFYPGKAPHKNTAQFSLDYGDLDVGQSLEITELSGQFSVTDAHYSSDAPLKTESLILPQFRAPLFSTRTIANATLQSDRLTLSGVGIKDFDMALLLHPVLPDIALPPLSGKVDLKILPNGKMDITGGQLEAGAQTPFILRITPERFAALPALQSAAPEVIQNALTHFIGTAIKIEPRGLWPDNLTLDVTLKGTAPDLAGDRPVEVTLSLENISVTGSRIGTTVE